MASAKKLGDVTAGDGRRYEIGHTERGEPVIRSGKSGRAMVFAWETLLEFAATSGLDDGAPCDDCAGSGESNVTKADGTPVGPCLTCDGSGARPGSVAEDAG